MIKPTLELIRDPEALEAAVSKGDADFAAECSLLKWSPENRKWLFGNRSAKSSCGLCYFYDWCSNCPLGGHLRACFHHSDFETARLAAGRKDFKKFNKAAEAFYDWMKGILNG